jgi:enoyl-CoA hydratase
MVFPHQGAVRMSYVHILVSSSEQIGLVRINRADALNAISMKVMEEIVHALEACDADPDIRCMILTGDTQAFAAGADIKEMMDASAMEMLRRDQFARWDRIRKVKKPLIAAVSGFALGGGCELAMACDMIVASETARFGQPEINLGVMPGAGGTQRLTRAVGKAKAMEMVLTGRTIDAAEALRWGLINRVVPVECYLDEAMRLAREIASKPPAAVKLAKESVLKSFDTTIEGGLEFERKNFYLLFSSEDQKEGMKAFSEKRKAEWRGK